MKYMRKGALIQLCTEENVQRLKGQGFKEWIPNPEPKEQAAPEKNENSEENQKPEKNTKPGNKNNRGGGNA